MSKPVFDVAQVCFSIDKSKPPQLHVAADGKVNSSGWKAGTLLPRIYVVPPSDGVLDLDFLATPPAGPALQVMLPISADVSVTLVEWIKGVRIHAATNMLVALLTDEACIVSLGSFQGSTAKAPDLTRR